MKLKYKIMIGVVILFIGLVLGVVYVRSENQKLRDNIIELKEKESTKDIELVRQELELERKDHGATVRANGLIRELSNADSVRKKRIIDSVVRRINRE